MDATRRPDGAAPADPHMFVLLHHALRTDLERLVAAIEALGDDRSDRARALYRWYRELARQIHGHHRAEDEVFFPALAARAAELASGDALQQQMADDHRYVSSLTDSVAERLRRLADPDQPWAEARHAAGADAAALAALVGDHFAHEERHVVPLFAQYFTAAEYEVLSRRADRVHRPPELLFALPWFFDHLAADTACDTVLAGTPAHVRLFAAALRPRYRRLVRAAGLRPTQVAPQPTSTPRESRRHQP